MEEDYLNKCIVYKTVHGSRAYGTNTPTSDYDEVGVAVIPDLSYYFGFKKFDHKNSGWSDGVDRKVYGIHKFFNLALRCNPNAIEVLFVEPSDIIEINELGSLILLNRDMFLSQFAAKTFVGYAASQLKRIRADTRNGKPIKHKHTMHIVRLLRMGKEIVASGEVIVRRPDYKELLEIRNGNYHYEDIAGWANNSIEEINSLVEKSPLPTKPNIKRAENLLIKIIKGVVSWE